LLLLFEGLFQSDGMQELNNNDDGGLVDGKRRKIAMNAVIREPRPLPECRLCDFLTSLD
jgi:hypothetical protein